MSTASPETDSSLAPDTAAPPPPARGRRWARRGLIAAAVVLALGVASWLGVPPLLKWQGEKIGTRELGRPVHIGKVDFKPWSLELTLNDLSIGGLPGAPDQLTIKRLYASAALQSIWKLAPVLDALQVDEPTLRLTHLGEGRYDIDDILARLAAQPKPAQPSEPAHFALYNIALKDGRIDFDDRTVGRVQEVRGLQLAVPFISNLPAARQVTVQPRLAFALNGSAFDSQGEALPFDASQRTTATLRLSKLDLKPYLGYLPAGLPIQLQAATVDADLKLAFEETPHTSLRVDGSLGVSDLKALDAQGGDALAFDTLKVDVTEARPLERLVHLGSVRLEGPQLDVRRDAAGRINLMPHDAPASAPQPAVAKGSAPVKAPASAASGAAAKPATPEPALKLLIDQVAVRGGALRWRDDSPAGEHAGAAELRADKVEFNAKAVAWPLQQPFAFDGALALAGGDAQPQVAATPTPAAAPAPKSAHGKRAAKAPTHKVAKAAAPAAPAAAAPGAATLAFDGKASERQAEVTLHAAHLPLALAQPYLAAYLVPQLGGQLDAEATLNWAAPQGRETQPAWSVQAKRVALEQLALVGEPMAAGQPDESAEAREPSEAQAAGGARPSRRSRTGAKPKRARRADETRARRTDGPRPSGAPGTLASIERVELSDAHIDSKTRAVSAARLQLQAPRVQVQRDAQQHWMAQAWLRTPPADAAPAAKPAAAAVDAPWSLRLDELAVAGGVVGWRDEGMRRVARAELSDLQIEARKLSLDGKQPMELNLKTLVGTGRRSGGEPGRLAWRGQIGLEPLSAQGTLEATRLPVQAFEPYFGDLLNVELLRADAGFKGRVAYAQTTQGPRVRVEGDARVEEMRSFSRPGTAANGDAAATPAAAARADAGSQAALAPSAGRTPAGLGRELLSWKQLRLDGLDAQLEPGKAPQVRIGGTQLSDFYARLVIDPSGRFNLQDIVKSDAASSTASAPGTAASAPVSAAASTPASSAAPAAAPNPLAPVIRFGPTQLVNGRIDFADHFIRPNYSADLTDLNGSLGAFSSVAQAGAPQMAALVLTGRAEGTAGLDIRGQLNPLAQPLALDIQAKVSDLDLPPLSPYAVKYAGHGIERGKLSMDVNYKILPDGQLTATNKLVLNQLEFGEAVPGAPASLPVQLATALLADSHGVIDLDLPISGSLNDPQFSIGPVIFKALINLIGKAITAPFSLLARALGGEAGQDMSQVAFAPGSAHLSAKARSQLDKVAKALADRPALKLTVAGSAHLDREREGAQRQRLYALVAAEARSATPAAAASAAPAAASSAAPAAAASAPAAPASAASGAAPAASEAEAAAAIATSPDYPALLKRLYRRADIPGKPRNAIGMLRDIGVPEMEALLMAHIEVGESAIRQLAVQRGVAVKDYLAGKGIAANRLFLGAVQTDASAAASAPASAASAAASAWAPHAELSLGTK